MNKITIAGIEMPKCLLSMFMPFTGKATPSLSMSQPKIFFIASYQCIANAN